MSVVQRAHACPPTAVAECTGHSVYLFSSEECTNGLINQLPAASGFRPPLSVFLLCGLSFGVLMALFCGPLRNPMALAWTITLHPQLSPWIIAQGVSHFGLPDALSSVQDHVLTHYRFRKYRASPYPDALPANHDTSPKKFSNPDVTEKRFLTALFLIRIPQ